MIKELTACALAGWIFHFSVMNVNGPITYEKASSPKIIKINTSWNEGLRDLANQRATNPAEVAMGYIKTKKGAEFWFPYGKMANATEIGLDMCKLQKFVQWADKEDVVDIRVIHTHPKATDRYMSNYPSIDDLMQTQKAALALKKWITGRFVFYDNIVTENGVYSFKIGSDQITADNIRAAYEKFYAPYETAIISARFEYARGGKSIVDEVKRFSKNISSEFFEVTFSSYGELGIVVLSQ